MLEVCPTYMGTSA